MKILLIIEYENVTFRNCSKNLKFAIAISLKTCILKINVSPIKEDWNIVKASVKNVEFSLQWHKVKYLYTC